MKDAKAILFDLDGCLTDPGQGIVNSMTYALEQMGITPPPPEDLRRCVGPPLRENLREYVSEERIEEGVSHFLHRMIDQKMGVTENKLYEGIPETLSALCNAGKTLYVATSKLIDLSVTIVEHFGLMPYFQKVHGAQKDGKDANKGVLIAGILAEHSLDPATTIMVGDRYHDIVGAQKNGLRSIGVGWGYGSEKELRDAGATAFAATPQDMIGLLV